MMIREVEIRNFKSIRELRLACRRINLFVGPPDSGKSNLLESLGMFGLPYDPEKLRAFARCRTMAELFHDLDVESPVRVWAGGYAWTLEREPSADPVFRVRSEPFLDGRYGPHANLLEASVNEAGLQDLPFRFYRFAAPDRFPAERPRFLRPPYGDNTLSLLLRREDLRRMADAVFAAHGLRLALKPEDGRIELRRGREGAAASWPYASGPSTLLRLAFHLLAVDSNDGAFLIFEEPEAHLYPHHVRLLGERIALDARNQYWISTHNPHFLLAVLEKAPLEDVAVFLTARRNGETWASPLGEEEIQGILDDGCGFFFDLERLMSLFERS